MIGRLAHLLGAFAVATAACAQTAPVPHEIRAHFACAESKSIDAIFVNGTASSVRLTLSDGRKLSLPQTRSGSGARYANGDESFVFWNKGNTAFVDEDGETTYAECVTQQWDRALSVRKALRARDSKDANTR